VIVAAALIAGACFGAAVMSALTAVGAHKGRCGDCAAWRLLAGVRGDEVADLQRQLDVLITNAIAKAEEFPW
jgi:hypothetical protein